MMVRMRRSGIVLLCFLVLSLLAGTGSVRATDEQTEFNPFNFAYATYIGSGFYSNGTRSIFVLQIPVSFKLRDDDARYFGLRFTTTPTFGFYDWTRDDMLEFDLPERLGTASITVGVEFRVPVLKNWRLDPFIDYGVGRDSEFNQTAYIFGTGIRSRAEWPWKERTILLWNEWLYASNLFLTVHIHHRRAPAGRLHHRGPRRGLRCVLQGRAVLQHRRRQERRW
jgi:uncharacterized protein YceK